MLKYSKPDTTKNLKIVESYELMDKNKWIRTSYTYNIHTADKCFERENTNNGKADFALKQTLYSFGVVPRALRLLVVQNRKNVKKGN